MRPDSHGDGDSTPSAAARTGRLGGRAGVALVAVPLALVLAASAFDPSWRTIAVAIGPAAPPPPPPRGPYVLLVGLALAADDVPDAVWARLAEWCAASAIDAVDIVLGHGSLGAPSRRMAAAGRAGGRECEVSTTLQSASLEQARLERMAAVRKEQQLRIRRRAAPPAYVVVVDLDEASLPPSGGVAAAVELVRSDQWDIVCAAGWMQDGERRKIYDKFALTLANGRYMFHRPKGALFNLYEEVAASAEPFRVKHCFGGLWVTRQRGVWDGGPARCDYGADLMGTQWSMSNETAGVWCEHIALLECLEASAAAAAAAPLRVGIWRELPVEWGGQGWR